MPHSERFLTYLRHYAAKNLDAIAAMFADDITLRDWNLAVTGKAAALRETAKNFASAQTIEIEPLHVYESDDGVAGELRIVIDDTLELFVVDALAFAADGRIQAIRAYLGRGDAPATP
ncbi:MAG TPA: nuclear transport factor 2 family protein [Chloroflexi bacterium]|nr:nuclear transport factor 2 family protein [Chloroflexota bacterium]